ncbi:Cu2+-exporting ATPase [Halovenus aranensis]|uniref:Cu2+-exporting ATPase n=1 Tax=Halovenus aranensis TaxID=890420 RepID=A0A1G8VT06_9EURY|nr:cation-translocating P-type ATPase [Halovenus aranensis]SDJ69129.1 Cu2+-exporting ATPase [Halovenus aranensis]
MTTCRLCSLPVTEPVRGEDVEGVFCCQGCLQVYQTVGDVETTEGTADRQPAPEDATTAFFAMDGMHCTTCEVYLESVATDCDGVYHAEASYAAEAVKVVYDSEALSREHLKEALSGTGYIARNRDTTSEDDVEAIENRLIVGAALGMMAMTAYAAFLYPTYFGYDPLVPLEPGDSAHIYGHLAALSAILVLYTGAPMLRGAYVSLRTRRPNVDLLVTTAALAAYTYSTVRLVGGHADLYYDVTVVVVLAVTAGTYYERRIRAQTSGLLTDLTPLQVETATRENGESVSVDAVDPGDRLLVKPGERVPVDGVVREGQAPVEEALVTGESLPETKSPDDTVVGGAVVTDAPLVIEATRGENTLDRVVDSLWEVQTARSGAQRFADRLATVFVPLVLTVAALVSGWLLLTAAPQTALLTGLTVLIVSCPCALGLATPLAVASGLQSAADRGVVVTTPALFEHVDAVDTVVFDKTGTLTDGEMAVRDIYTPGDATEETVLARAGAVEQHATHPVATAVAAASPDARTDGGALAVERAGRVSSFEGYDRGVAATVDGRRVLVGHPKLFDDRGYAVSADIERRAATAADRGAVPVVVGWDGTARGVLTVGDEDRQAWESVATALGDRTVVLTGDDGPAAERLAANTAVDEVFAGMKPDGKAVTVRRLAATETVAMVGDGSNDAPALAAADIGVALEQGTELALDAADAVVLGDDLRRLPDVFAVAAATRRRIRENLAWAFVYNAIAIPLAVSGLLNPLFAALAMATSSLLVVANAARTTDGREKNYST